MPLHGETTTGASWWQLLDDVVHTHSLPMETSGKRLGALSHLSLSCVLLGPLIPCRVITYVPSAAPQESREEPRFRFLTGEAWS